MNRRDLLKLAGITGLMGGTGAAGRLAAHLQPPMQQFYAPDRIRYDGRSFFIEDKPFFIFSGSFHYFRCPRELWPQRFAKIRDAGFNTIQTYASWNYHEPLPPSGPEDYSRVNMEELDAFLTMATDYGFYISMRVGPYLCGEWDTGGYPQWLMTKIPPHYRGMWVRTANPEYTQWANHWMGAVCPVVARHQLLRKPKGGRGIILVQIENEYGLIGIPLAQKKRHMEDLVQQARGHGIRVPLMSNLAGFVVGSHGRIAHEIFDTIDRYPGWDLGAMGHRIKHYRTGQEDAPVMAAEMQGGWFTPVSASPSLRTDVDAYPDQCSPEQTNALTLYSVAHGMTALNYYMLFGGTNFASHAAQGVATSYDYSAAIRECGGVGAKWQKVKALGKMFQLHGTALARATHLPVKMAGKPALKIWARIADNRDIYLFVFNPDRMRTAAGRTRLSVGPYPDMELTYRLTAGDFNIFFIPAGTNHMTGRWLLKSQPLPPRPRNIPSAVHIERLQYHADPLPSNWKHVPAGQSLAQMGVYESTMSYYRCQIETSASVAGKSIALSVGLPGQDSVIATVNGHVARPLAQTGALAILPLHQSLHRVSEVTYLYENTGHVDNGWGLQAPYGIERVGVMPYQQGADMVTAWRLAAISKLPRKVSSLPQVQADFDDSSWRRLDIGDKPPQQIGHRKAGILRSEFTLSRRDINARKTLLRFAHISSRGWVFVNGRQIGMAAGQGATVDITSAARAGRNSIAVVVQVFGRTGGLGGVQLLYQPDTLGRQHGPMLLSAEPVGVRGGWYQPGYDATHWKVCKMGDAAPDAGALLHWYRMEFTLPEVAADIWVPWCLKIDASGNGLLYVNGHWIGRFWQNGGQREYYIPDNWLRPAGEANVIAVCLRPVDKAPGVHAAAVLPYRVYAEYKVKA